MSTVIAKMLINMSVAKVNHPVYPTAKSYINSIFAPLALAEPYILIKLARPPPPPHLRKVYLQLAQNSKYSGECVQLFHAILCNFCLPMIFSLFFPCSNLFLIDLSAHCYSS